MNDQMDKMHTLSRFIIFVPLVILVFAFYFKYTTPDRSAQNTTIQQIKPTPKIESGFMDLLKQGTTEAKIDLNGSYKCEYNANNKVVNASIKNKKIYVEFTTKPGTDSALINGDCAYKWQKGAFSGTKMCGVSQLMSMYESLSSLPFMGSDALFSMLGTVNPSVTIAPEELKSISKSCKKQQVEDIVFSIPPNISFKNNGTFTSTPQQ